MTETATDFEQYPLYQDPYVNYLHSQISKVEEQKKEVYHADDFAHFDGMHFCGLNYLAEFIDSINTGSTMKLLSLASGCGSEARFVAQRYSVDMVSCDFVQGLCEVSTRINALCGLSECLKVYQADVRYCPLEEWGCVANCDAVYCIQSFLHIPDKPLVLENCNKAIKPGGKLYIEDLTTQFDLPVNEAEQHELDHLRFCSRPTQPEYTALLETAGFTVDDYTFRTEEWSRYGIARAEKYLGMKEQIIADLGQETWDGRFSSGVYTVPKLYHMLNMTFEEAKAEYPLLAAEFGDEEFRKWVEEVPQKFGGTYITCTKVREL